MQHTDTANAIVNSLQQKAVDTVVIGAGLAASFMDAADGFRGFIIWILPFVSFGYIIYRWLWLRKLGRQNIQTQIKQEGEA